MKSEDNHLVQVNTQKFERTVPIIHKEGKNNYVLIQKTKSGMVRIMARVSSEAVARRSSRHYDWITKVHHIYYNLLCVGLGEII